MPKLKEEYCTCKDGKGVHAEDVGEGYWYCCNTCKKRIEGEFHYHDEPVLY